MTTCPHCGQPMPTSRLRREPVLESLPEADDRQLAALADYNLWNHPGRWSPEKRDDPLQSPPFPLPFKP